MYLTFDLSTRELINFSDEYVGMRNITKNGFVYVDEYIAIKQDNKVDFIETRFDEDSQLNTIVPGQHVITDYDLEILEIHKQRQDTISLANKFKNGLIAQENLGYVLTVGRIGNSSYEQRLITDVAKHFGMKRGTLQKLLRNRYEELIQKFIYVDIAFEQFKLETSFRKTDFDSALIDFKDSVQRNVDSLIYVDSNPFSDIG